MKIAVIGAGSWGTSIANLLAKKGYEIGIWDIHEEVCKGINENKRNPFYIKDVSLAEMYASTSAEEILKSSEVVVLGVPSAYVRLVLPKLKSHLSGQKIISLAKGLETGTLLRVSQIVEQELKGLYKSVSVLCGPNHAEEVSLEVPSATVISSSVEEDAAELQKIFMTPYFRVYTNSDLVGVELGGAIKNVIAVAAGMSDGLGFGDNTKASMMTRGLAEMKRLGAAMGATAETFSGLSGIGDLIATCTSRHSRNRRIGELIGKGISLKDAEAQLGMVAEGVHTSLAVKNLAEQQKVEMPISAGVADILFDERIPADVVKDLMSRGATSENIR